MTTYDEIYELFLSKIEDYEIHQKLVVEIDFVKEMMFDFLRSAIPKFTYVTKDLSERDDSLNQFNNILTDMEKEILAILMVVEYLSPKIIRDEYIESRLGSKDYREFSPANQLKVLMDLRQNFINEANSLMIEYYYRQDI